MPEKIKLIWDFRGPTAEQIAAHHAIHLKDYARIHHLSENTIGCEAIAPKHHIAYMIVPRSEMISVRDALKPHRGIIIEGDE